MTPAMQQFAQIKSEYSDHMVLFRMGDFYETFYEDAKLASQILGITLTARDKEKKIPMAGIPYHALDSYLNKLIEANQKVVLVEQLEDPKQAIGIVKRGIVKIFTPGTADLNYDKRKNVFLASVNLTSQKQYEISFIDINDGIINYLNSRNLNDFYNNLQILDPKEIILPENLKENGEIQKIKDKVKDSLLSFLDRSFFENINFSKDYISEELVNDLKKKESKSIYGLLNYLYETQRTSLSHILHIKEYTLENHVKLDYNVVSNLELLEGQRRDSVPLISILDHCSTLGGSRLLRQWLIAPLTSLELIQIRQRLVNSFYILGIDFIKYVQTELKQVHDLARISSKIGLSSANARDLRNLVNTVRIIFQLISTLIKHPQISTDLEKLCNKILLEIKEIQDVLSEINNTIVDEPPLTTREGGMIKPEYNKELFELYQLKNGSKKWIKDFEINEIKKTGINNLKVRFNKVFGYYIEISKGNISKVPNYYIRKQTLVNAERYITPELKEHEAKVLSAEDQINYIEFEIFNNLLIKTKKIIPSIQNISSMLSEIDIYCCFAHIAINEDWTMPQVSDDFEINIEDGRHPVIEKILKNSGKLFVKNSFYCDKNNSLQIITGPNMGGKSTYLRQVALIVLLAQIGSFVPASKAEIGIVDQIFTRIGASDNLSAGQSTFMVEMLETADIIKNATKRSLIILDEVGRGTSTFDGMSIAWAICEYLADLGCKTLFATHYHELTELANKYLNVKNLTVKVIDYNGEIVFMHQIYQGKADKSYGLHVAKLAGLPESILKKSEKVLKLLEKEKNKLQPRPQDLFTEIEEKEDNINLSSGNIIKELKNIDVEKLSPLEALQIIDRWKKQIN